MMSRKDKLPRAITVTNYEDLSPWIAGFAKGTFNLLFLIGRPGVGKSQLAKKILEGQRHAWIDCHATKLGMYFKLFDYRNAPVVVDDENTLISDPAKLSLMNALCQTNAEKTLRWDSTTRLLEERGVPAEFTTRSSVLVITNRLKNVSSR